MLWEELAKQGSLLTVTHQKNHIKLNLRETVTENNDWVESLSCNNSICYPI